MTLALALAIFLERTQDFDKYFVAEIKKNLEAGDVVKTKAAIRHWNDELKGGIETAWPGLQDETWTAARMLGLADVKGFQGHPAWNKGQEQVWPLDDNRIYQWLAESSGKKRAGRLLWMAAFQREFDDEGDIERMFPKDVALAVCDFSLSTYLPGSQNGLTWGLSLSCYVDKAHLRKEVGIQYEWSFYDDPKKNWYKIEGDILATPNDVVYVRAVRPGKGKAGKSFSAIKRVELIGKPQYQSLAFDPSNFK